MLDNSTSITFTGIDDTKKAHASMQANAAKTSRAMAAMNAAYGVTAKKTQQEIAHMSRGMRTATRQMRAYWAQVGYQIQDVAVQIQAGQNALFVIAQQGSQLASVFGTGGAVVGAVVAVSAAIAGSLLPTLFDAEKHLENMASNLDALFESMERGAKLTKVNLSAMAVVQANTLRDELVKVQDLQRQLDEAKAPLAPTQRAASATESLSKQGGILGLSASIFGTTKEEAAEASTGVAALTLELDQAQQAADKARKRLEAIGAAMEGVYTTPDEIEAGMSEIDDIAKEFEAMESASDRAAESLKRQAQAFEIANVPAAKFYSQLAELEKLQPHVSAEAYESALFRIHSAFEQLEGATEMPKEDLSELDAIAKEFEDMEKASDRAAESLKRQARAFELANNPAAKFYDQLEELEKLKPHISAEAYSNALLNIHAGFEQLEGMTEIPETMATEWEKAAKAMESSIEGAITDSIVNFKSFSDVISSISNQIASMVVSQTISKPLASAISSIDYGSLFSFDGGGFTGMGARSGGVDGRGGFPAILHPNETVVDHSKGQKMGGDTINVTYSPQVNALDPRTAATVLAQNARTIEGIIEQSLNRRGRSFA